MKVRCLLDFIETVRVTSRLHGYVALRFYNLWLLEHKLKF